MGLCQASAAGGAHGAGWFALFPAADWSYDLLAVATAALALWIAWRISGRFLDGEKRVVGLALLTLVPFFNFHALKFNQNTLLMPLWAATTLLFLRSFETRRVSDAALAGVTAAAAMYGKYWSIFLIAGLGVAALADPRRAVYFRSPAPWVTVAVGALALAPHVAWLVANGFEPFSYAVLAPTMAARPDVGEPGGGVRLSRWQRRLRGGRGRYRCSSPRARAAARSRDSLWPATPERRLAAVAFWATLLSPHPGCDPCPSSVSRRYGVCRHGRCCRSMFLSSPLVAVRQRHAARVLMVAVPLWSRWSSSRSRRRSRSSPIASASRPRLSHSSLLAAPVERLWRETSDQPLRLFSSYEDFNYGVAFYLPSRPLTVKAVDGIPPPGPDERIERDGIVLVVPARPSVCLTLANARAAQGPAGKRLEVEVARGFLGTAGQPARYLIVAIPPRT